MKKMFLCAVALTVAAIVASAASAQAPKCKGTVTVTGVTTKVSEGHYAYSVKVVNVVDGMTSLTLSFGNFPHTIDLFSPSLPGIKLSAKGKSETIKIGTGSVAAPNMKFYYDQALSTPGQPYVLAGGCAVMMM